ncbi:MAG TPA: hypothetical protein VGM21_08765 [Actinomycetota bacterium]
MSDEEAFEHYKEPENRKPAGGVYEVPKGALSRHVPIRFRPQTIARAKAIAERDGMTVSSWIRGVVEREVERRMPAPPQTRHSPTGAITWQVVRGTDLADEARTQNLEWIPNSDQTALA